MTAEQLFAVSASDVADTSDDCYTPPWIFDAAGLVFDLDVAAPVNLARRTCPARRYLTVVEDGLTHPWDGLVWMNPPYSRIAPWVDRWADHPDGLALLPAMHEVKWLGVLMSSADAMTLPTVEFSRPGGGNPVRWRQPAILAARGAVSVSALGRVAAADKYVRGAYHVRSAT